ncbi:MAG: 3-keto-disaccharide hydrolase, partial [Akkermansiaceae bacterium]
NIGEAVAPPAPQKLKGYTSLYNGKDLTGWKNDPGHKGHWQPRGAVLHYDGKSTAKDKNLWSEKEYGDMILAIDWRWAAPASHKTKRPLLDPKTGEAKKDANGKPIILLVDELDSGIYLRGNNRSQVNLWNWPGGSGEVYGYRTNKNHPQAIRAALTPKVKADKPIGEWNRMFIQIKGDRLSVVLNGKKVIENAQLPGVPKKGRIALQHHGSAIEFANIAIKEL